MSSDGNSGGNGVLGSSNDDARGNFDDDRPVEGTSPSVTVTTALQNLASEGGKNCSYLEQVSTAIHMMESKHQTSDPRYAQLKTAQARLLRKFLVIDRLKNPINANISSEHNRQLASQATFFSYLKSAPSVPVQLMQAALLRQPLSSQAESSTDSVQTSLQNYIIQQQMHWPTRPEFVYPKPEGVAVPVKFAASSSRRVIEQQAAVEVDASVKTRVDVITKRLKQFESSSLIFSTSKAVDDLSRPHSSDSRRFDGINRRGPSATQLSTPQQQKPPEYLRLQAELKALNLKELQRRVRKDFDVAQCSSAVVDAEQPRFSGTTKSVSQYRDERRRLVLNQIEERREKQHRQKFLAAILQRHREFKDAHKQNQQRASKIVRAVGARLLFKEREREKEQDRLERERMKRLMLENEAEYFALVARKRDQRLAQFLQQTDQFIAQLTDLVMQHKSHQAAKPPVVSSSSSQQNDSISGENSTVYPHNAVLSDDARLREVLKATRREDEAYFSSVEHATPSHATGENTSSSTSNTTAAPTGVVDEAYYAVAHSITERIIEQPSIMRGGKLKEYQLRGLEWLVSLYNNHLNGILADEMGLGKTIQTIALIAYLVEKKHMTGPYIIIVPLSTMCNWLREFEYWAPSLVTIAYSGTKADRAAMMPQIKAKRFNVLITTYDYVMRDTHKLKKIDWQYMIIDEGHRMKNAQCKLTLTLNKYYDVKHRLLLTGTPLQNRLPELWALLNFVLPSIFKSCDTFEQWFNAPFALPGEKDKVDLKEEDTMLIVRRLHKVLRPFLLRRLKKEVAAELPDKLEYVVKCPMSALQRVLYEHMEKYKTVFNSQQTPTSTDADSEDFVALTTNTTSSSATYASNNNRKAVVLANTIMQLRKICNHPFLFEGCEKTIGQHIGYSDGYVNGPDLYRVCGKFEMLDRLLPKLERSGHRCLIFCQMTSLMSILEDFLRMRNITYLRLDGTTKADERDALMEKFRAPDSPYFVFLLSTRAGGVGLNLQAADTVIIFDQDWNPTQDQQAQDRVHRIGQKRKVLVLRLLTVNSIEEKIEAAAQRKRDMDQVVIQAGLFDAKSTVSERQQFLQSILGSRNTAKASEKQLSGAVKGIGTDAGVEENDFSVVDAADADAVDIPDDEMINEMISRSTEEFELFQRMDVERAEKDDKVELKGKPRLMQENELPTFMQQSVAGENGPVAESSQRNEVSAVVKDDVKTKQVFESPLAIRSLLGLKSPQIAQKPMASDDIWPSNVPSADSSTKANEIFAAATEKSDGTIDDRLSSVASSGISEQLSRAVHAISGEMNLSPKKTTISIVTPQIGRFASSFSATVGQPSASAATVLDANDANHRASKRKRKVLYENLGDSNLFEDKNATQIPRKRGRPLKYPRPDDGTVDADADAADAGVSNNNGAVRVPNSNPNSATNIMSFKKVRVKGGKRGRPKGSTAARKLELMMMRVSSGESGEIRIPRYAPVFPGPPIDLSAVGRARTADDDTVEKQHNSFNNGKVAAVFSRAAEDDNHVARAEKPDEDELFWLPPSNTINSTSSSTAIEQTAHAKVPFLGVSGVPNRFAVSSTSSNTMKLISNTQNSNHHPRPAAAAFRIAKKPKTALATDDEQKAVDQIFHHSAAASNVPNGKSSRLPSSSSSVSLVFPRNRLPAAAGVQPQCAVVDVSKLLLPVPNTRNGDFSARTLKSGPDNNLHHFATKSFNSVMPLSILPQLPKRSLTADKSSADDADEAEEGELSDSDDNDDEDENGDDYYDNVSDEADDDDADDDHDQISDDDDIPGEASIVERSLSKRVFRSFLAANGVVEKTAGSKKFAQRAVSSTTGHTVAPLKIKSAGGSSEVLLTAPSFCSASSSNSSQLSITSSSNPSAAVSGPSSREPGVVVREETNGPMGTPAIKLRIKF